MGIEEQLRKLGLTNDDTKELLSNGTRDCKNLKVFKDGKSGIIYIEDHKVDDSIYREGSYRSEIGKETGKKSVRNNYEAVTDCDRRTKAHKALYVDKDIIDFGCGYGDFLKAVKSETCSCMGIEIQKDCIDDLRLAGIKCENNFENIKDGSIDTCFMFHSLEHMNNPLEVLLEAKRVLRNDGRIVIVVPHARDFLINTIKCEEFISFTLWSQHLVLHTRESLETYLKESGFEDIVIKGYSYFQITCNGYRRKTRRSQGKLAIIDNSNLKEAYANALASMDATDTLVWDGNVLMKRSRQKSKQVNTNMRKTQANKQISILK